MQQHQFESFKSALAYLNDRGKPTYWGWIGTIDGYYLYTFVDKIGIKWRVNMYINGLIEYEEVMW